MEFGQVVKMDVGIAAANHNVGMVTYGVDGRIYTSIIRGRLDRVERENE